MHRSWPIALSAMLLLSACGGDEDGVDLSGDTPDEAADEIASATCERRVECGGWDYEIETDENGEVISCTPVEDPVDQDACVSETRADLREVLECAQPTEDELSQLENCVNDTVGQDCVTQEDLQVFCDAVLAGEDPEDPLAAPPSCDALVEIIDGCSGAGP